MRSRKPIGGQPRTTEARERDPRPEQRGLRGPRPGRPPLDGVFDVEAKIALPVDLLALVIVFERISRALHPPDDGDDRTTVAEAELLRRLKGVNTARELRQKYSTDELIAMRGNLERALTTASKKVFDGLGDDGRLWWLNRLVRRRLRHTRQTVGQRMIAEWRGPLANLPSGTQLSPRQWLRAAKKTTVVPGKVIGEKTARHLAAVSVGLKGESSLRKLAPDRISLESVDRRTLRESS